MVGTSHVAMQLVLLGHPVNCVNRATLRLQQHEQLTSGRQSRWSSIVEDGMRGIQVVNKDASVDAGAEMGLREGTGTSKDSTEDVCAGSLGTVGSSDDGDASRSNADVFSAGICTPTRARRSARGIMALHKWKRVKQGLFAKSSSDVGGNGGVGKDHSLLTSNKIVNLVAKVDECVSNITNIHTHSRMCLHNQAKSFKRMGKKSLTEQNKSKCFDFCSQHFPTKQRFFLADM